MKHNDPVRPVQTARRPQREMRLDEESGQPFGDQTAHDVDLSLLSPALLARLGELINEVAQELASGGDNDADTCRADAISLLVAASEKQMQKDEPEIESVLKYRLLQEEAVAKSLLNKKSFSPPAKRISKA